MKIWRITFTGIDDNTNLEEINRISNFCSQVEWGILFSKSKIGVPRYPSRDVIENICKLNVTLAAHLCGKWVRDILDGNFTFIDDKISSFFERIQLNCGKDNIKKMLNLSEVISIADHDVMIGGDFSDIQKEDLFEGAFLLFDKSGGNGKSPESWPSPYEGFSCGYAGGLCPENLEYNLKQIEKVVGDKEIWIDMESGIRTNEEFDLQKVQECLKIAKNYF